MMQIKPSTFIKNILTFFLLLCQFTDTQAQSRQIKIADSLFVSKNYFQAESYYENSLLKKEKANSSIYLKLAFISENLGNTPKSLYYLNLYYLKHPSKSLFNKMNLMAIDNNYKGYENSDLNFLVLLIRQYYIQTLVLLLGFSILIFVILVYKKQTNQFIPAGQSMVLIVFLLVFLVLVNLPANYKAVIIKKNIAYLRNYPSSASPIVGNITIGNKLNVISTEDIWHQVLHENQLVYIKDTDVWEVK